MFRYCRQKKKRVYYFICYKLVLLEQCVEKCKHFTFAESVRNKIGIRIIYGDSGQIENSWVILGAFITQEYTLIIPRNNLAEYFYSFHINDLKKKLLDNQMLSFCMFLGFGGYIQTASLIKEIISSLFLTAATISLRYL